MDGTEGSGGQPGPAERSHRSSVSSVGARAAADVLVYLADDSVVPLAVENLPALSAQELHRAVREVLQLPDVALEAFALWLVSPLLEVQLKPKHQPYKLGRQWPELLLRFTDAPDDDVAMDEPSSSSEGTCFSQSGGSSRSRMRRSCGCSTRRPRATC